MVQPDRPQTTWHKRFGCWLTKATHTHSEYVTLLSLPRQQWLRERACVTFVRTSPVLPTFKMKSMKYPRLFIETHVVPGIKCKSAELLTLYRFGAIL